MQSLAVGVKGDVKHEYITSERKTSFSCLPPSRALLQKAERTSEAEQTEKKSGKSQLEAVHKET